ncbi:cellulase family glycosylhydrolase [Aestuariivivens sp. NBU2969]|uniref:cellulase family glycosylhydrolase n=1 Tax=Aestuariivivens sp. NBU2969 TaxID=2873267 RepID=UPI001CBC26A0|nr:cellulase family glycosylhydrolase [Aestuariivivens sp. NBU2969]
MTRVQLFSLLFITTLFFQMCKPKDTLVMNQHNKHVSIKGQNFVDSLGRTLTLHGISVCNKDPKTNYLGHITPEEFKMFKEWGFNVIRLGIIWDGLEPEPGVYNQEYLKGIDDMIQWATDNDLYVFLDMHQDLFSVDFSDGAPSWATITNDQPHLTGDVWSEAYLISPAVQTAFDNFWANTPAPDGVGIQDHYLNLWKYLAERYKDNTRVIGFDVMNEPFMGSEANKITPLLLESYAKLLAEQTGEAPPSLEEVMHLWNTNKMEVLGSLSDKETYKKWLDVIYEVNSVFERGTLTAFYQKARDEIRKVNKHHIIFTEHSYFTNMGLVGALGEIVDENGQKDPLVAYAAHGYDLVVDTDALTLGSNDRVELIFERIAQTGQRLDVPVLIGEWGALHGKSPDLIPTAHFLLNQFNKHGFSDAFWAYGEFLLEASFLDVLKKPYPVETSGVLENYSFDYESGTFNCTWHEDEAITAPTRIYVSDISKLNKDTLQLTPEIEGVSIEEMEHSKAGHLVIPASGKKLERKLTFTLIK